MTVEIDVRIENRDWTVALPDALGVCQQTARSALAAGAPGTDAAELGIVLTDDMAIAGLNRDFRDKDAPTNVLAFAAESGGPEDWPALPAGVPRLLGDVVVAYETTVAEATAAQITLDHHLRHLVVHGVLHLLGHDHQMDDEADRMEALEITILGRLGVDNPYADRTHSAA